MVCRFLYSLDKYISIRWNINTENKMGVFITDINKQNSKNYSGVFIVVFLLNFCFKF